MSEHPGKAALKLAASQHGEVWDESTTPRISAQGLVDAISYVSDLEARLEKAREVIEPFAAFAALYDPDQGDEGHIAHIGASLGQLRAARAWMEQSDE